ncbi:unnamed protein product [Brachionus calyciflorus]|uniref:Uncharacterized protein n=1 Tax=Brachionus calyciflorus TaxID=104777 RepID=A0A813WP59_9BILA|nr:unnamed protein product [Brachionus calyciflorus]
MKSKLKKSFYASDSDIIACMTDEDENLISKEETTNFNVDKPIHQNCEITTNVIKILTSNFKIQLQKILDNHYHKIEQYIDDLKSKKPGAVSDIIDSELYIYKKDTKSLVLFIDGESYNKSNSFSQWFLLSQICHQLQEGLMKILFFIHLGVAQI